MGTCLLGRRAGGLCLGFRFIGLELQVLCFLFCCRCLGFLGLGGILVLRHAAGHGIASHGAHHPAYCCSAQRGAQTRAGCCGCSGRWRCGSGRSRCRRRPGSSDGRRCRRSFEAGRRRLVAAHALGVGQRRRHERGDGQRNHGSCIGAGRGRGAHKDLLMCEKRTAHCVRTP